MSSGSDYDDYDDDNNDDDDDDDDDDDRDAHRTSRGGIDASASVIALTCTGTCHCCDRYRYVSLL